LLAPSSLGLLANWLYLHLRVRGSQQVTIILSLLSSVF
jgi:hypothetical protein